MAPTTTTMATSSELQSLPPPAPARAVDRVLAPLGAFFSNKIAGALVLLAAALGAVVWAASPAGDVYFALLSTKLTIAFGDTPLLSKSLQHWINDGLMAVFFFLVGLEVKREVLVGELASLRRAALPGFAAIGGMVVPALLYLALNAGGPGERGWGVPMATDIAFALGVLALAGDRVPTSLKVFLTALAIVDDIGAVLVIAIFYTAELSTTALGFGLLAATAAVGLNALRVQSPVPYLIVGIACWFGFLQSGVHATIAALLIAFTIPARTRIDGEGLVDHVTRLVGRLREGGLPNATRLPDLGQQALVERLGETVGHATSPLIRIEHGLVGPVTFLVLPLFALANAGVAIEGGLASALSSPIALGIVAGLLVGKTLGVSLFAWLSVRLGFADRPADVSWTQIVAAAMLSGIGFTMALFIAGLAFPTAAGLDQAKVGILVASLVAGVGGFALLRRGSQATASAPAAKDAVA